MSTFELPADPALLEVLKKKFASEAARNEAENKSIELANEMVRIARDDAQRKEKNELARNVYHHVYNFNGEVSGNSVSTCIDQLTNWSRIDPNCKIDLVINSGGGDIFPGFALFDFIEKLKENGHFITTTGLGMVASMAGVLLQAGNKRVLGASAFLLIHEAAFGAIGKTGDVEDRVALVNMMQDRILDIFANRSNLTKRQLRTRWRRKDWWMNSETAHKFGLVDEVGA